MDRDSAGLHEPDDQVLDDVETDLRGAGGLLEHPADVEGEDELGQNSDRVDGGQVPRDSTPPTASANWSMVRLCSAA